MPLAWPTIATIWPLRSAQQLGGGEPVAGAKDVT